jgi:acetyltransferase
MITKTVMEPVETLDANRSATAVRRSATAKAGLDALFLPETVAVIGASERAGTVGRTVLENLLHGTFQGRIFPVNPKRPQLLGVPAYPNLAAIPETADLAVIATPAPTVPGIIAECVDAGVRSVVVISAGFREKGKEGAALEEQIRAELRRSTNGMRLIGPNCLGVMTPRIGFNATFANDIARTGNVAFLSQSGALLTGILDWSKREQVGFSAIVSTGSMLDVGWGDLIYHFGDDPNTKSILLYMESVGDARSFLSAAREVALTKPIIVIKPGRSEAASRAAASHTGALTGSDEVLDAAFRRCGVLRVQNISDLFYMAEVLGKQPRPEGKRLTILTNAGGPAVLATDSLIANGGELAALAPATIEKLNSFLPEHWSHNNPIDVLGDASAELYAKAIEVAAADANSDGLLVVLAPQGMTDPTQIAERLTPYAKAYGKPVLASWMGGPAIAEGESVLNAAGIPTMPYPDTAARAFTYMWRYNDNLRALYETPALSSGPEVGPNEISEVGGIIKRAREKGRVLLNEFESKRLLSLYGIPTVETHIACSEEEAVAHAGKMGYPVVLKIFSETITHKTDVGGVQLNLRDEAAVRQAFQQIKTSVSAKVGPEHFAGVTVQQMVKAEGYELILGSSIDSQFGPVLLFGSGGQLVEVYKDRALGLPPLNFTLAQRLMEQTRVFTALKGVRGRKPVNLDALKTVLVRFSQLVLEQPWISEIDINPLLASPDKLLALDARIVLHDPAMDASQLPKSAIRPYPVEYVSKITLKDGAQVTLRPIRPEDEPLMVKFHETLSDRTVYLRYFCSMSLGARVAHDRLLRICFGDYDRDLALVAESKDPVTGATAIVGVGRLNRLRSRKHGEVAILVSDRFQRRGLGLVLMERLIEIARREQFSRLSSEMLRDNIAMQAISKKVGFRIHMAPSSTSFKAELDL